MTGQYCVVIFMVNIASNSIVAAGFGTQTLKVHSAPSSVAFAAFASWQARRRET